MRLMRPCSVKLQVISSVVLLAAGLTGCGGSEEPAAASAAASSTETSAPAAPNVPAAPVDSPAAPAGAPAGPPPDTDSQASGETPGAVGAGMSSSGGPPGGMPMGGPPGGMPMGGPPGGDLAMAGAMSGGGAGMPMSGMGMAGMPGMPGMPAGAAGVPVTARPADLSKWSTKDMKDAVRERDRQVLKVIDQKVKESPGDPQVAALLMELLAASNEQPVAPAAGNAMPGGFPGAAGGYPGSAGYGSMPGMPGGLGGAGLGGSSLQGGAGYGGGAPLPGDDSGTLVSPAGGSAPSSGMPPQSSLEPSLKHRPVDSLEAMFVEAATAWQAQPGVGAMRSGFKVPAPGQAAGTPGAPDDGIVPEAPGCPPECPGDWECLECQRCPGATCPAVPQVQAPQVKMLQQDQPRQTAN